MGDISMSGFQTFFFLQKKSAENWQLKAVHLLVEFRALICF